MTPRKPAASRKRLSSSHKKKKSATKITHVPELVIITGMSGSGKASALKAFEDLGYYCVDNLPVELIPRFAEMALQSAEIRRTALVVDVREGSKLEQLPGILKAVRRMIPTKLVFWEASDAEVGIQPLSIMIESLWFRKKYTYWSFASSHMAAYSRLPTICGPEVHERPS